MSDDAHCGPDTVPFTKDAMKASLLRLQNEWEAVQASRDRAAVYQYLAAVFETVMVWAKENKAVSRAGRALHLRGYSSLREPEPFAAVILCTSDPDKVDDRTRSKWSRVVGALHRAQGRFQQMCWALYPAPRASGLLRAIRTNRILREGACQRMYPNVDESPGSQLIAMHCVCE
jgi:hypothetical protein